MSFLSSPLIFLQNSKYQNLSSLLQATNLSSGLYATADGNIYCNNGQLTILNQPTYSSLSAFIADLNNNLILSGTYFIKTNTSNVSIYVNTSSTSLELTGSGTYYNYTTYMADVASGNLPRGNYIVDNELYRWDNSQTNHIVEQISLLCFSGKNTVDFTSALNTAATYCKNNGASLIIPRGTFNHSGIVTFDSISVYGPGTLNSTDNTGTNQSVVLVGSNPLLSGVTLNSAWAGVRQSQFYSHKLVLSSAIGFRVERCNVLKSAAAGIINYSSTGGEIVSNYVTNTLADGITSTRGANSVKIHSNKVYGSGDDGISLVGYSGGSFPTNFLIQNNDVKYTLTRGITCVGASNVSIHGNIIERVYTAGVYITGESSYNTYASNNIAITNNVVIGCGNNRSYSSAMVGSSSVTPTVLPAVTFFNATSYTMSGIRFTNNFIIASAQSAINAIGSGGTVNDISITDNTIYDTCDLYNKNGISITTATLVSNSTILPLPYTTRLSYGQLVTDRYGNQNPNCISGVSIPQGTTLVAGTMTGVTLSNGVTVPSGTILCFWGGGDDRKVCKVQANTNTATVTLDSTTGISIGSQLTDVTNTSAVNFNHSGGSNVSVIGFSSTAVTLSAAPNTTINQNDFIQFFGFLEYYQTISSGFAVTTGSNQVTYSGSLPIFVGTGIAILGFASGTYITQVSGSTLTLSANSTATNSNTGASLCGATQTDAYTALQVAQLTNFEVNNNRVIRPGGRAIYVAKNCTGVGRVNSNIIDEPNMGFTNVGRSVEFQNTANGAAFFECKNNYMKVPTKWPSIMDANVLVPSDIGAQIKIENNYAMSNFVSNKYGNGVSSLSLTGSPFVYTNIAPQRTLVSVSGGTVSLIELSVDNGATYFNTGITNGIINLDYADRLRITYSSAPTVQYQFRTS